MPPWSQAWTSSMGSTIDRVCCTHRCQLDLPHSAAFTRVRTETTHVAMSVSALHEVAGRISSDATTSAAQTNVESGHGCSPSRRPGSEAALSERMTERQLARRVSRCGRRTRTNGNRLLG